MAGTCSGTIIVTIPCTPNWQCESGQTGYETDGCGNRRANPTCTYRERKGIGAGTLIGITLLGVGCAGSDYLRHKEVRNGRTEVTEMLSKFIKSSGLKTGAVAVVAASR